MDGEDVGKIRRILEHHEDKIADFATSRSFRSRAKPASKTC